MSADLHARLHEFMSQIVLPAERTYVAQHAAFADRWTIPPVMEEMKAAARQAGLWNLFLPDSDYGAGLSNEAYAPLCETMGHSFVAPEVFNCNAPDTGNMEVLVRYGTEEQRQRWLEPLLRGEIRSAFAMTEPDVASSDATSVRARIARQGDAYVIDGRKWWATGALDPRCELLIVMGRTDGSAPKHLQQTMILVPLRTPGVTVVRPLTVFGYDDAPHGHAELLFDGVRVPATNVLLGEGRGFEIAQGRLGPGRIHHCMRSVGAAERALAAMCARALERAPFGKPLAEQGVVAEWIADSRIEIDQARLLTMHAARRMDEAGNKAARTEIAAIKVVAPNVALRVIDRAIQTFGAAGVSEDPGLAHLWAEQRALRLADGPDEVHRASIAKFELANYRRSTPALAEPVLSGNS